MSVHPTTGDWVVVAVASTVTYTVAARWCMPTAKAKRRVSFAPLAGWVFLVPSATAKGYSIPYILYLFSCTLLMMAAMLVPIRKRVAAAIMEQEQNSRMKVQLNAVSVWWIVFSFAGCAAAMVRCWPLVH
ncbi:hypothetical protein ACNFR7_10095 [Streptomyces sp. RM1]